jgi:hypothetical protein
MRKFHGSISVSQRQWDVKQITNNKYTQFFQCKYNNRTQNSIVHHAYAKKII